MLLGWKATTGQAVGYHPPTRPGNSSQSTNIMCEFKQNLNKINPSLPAHPHPQPAQSSTLKWYWVILESKINMKQILLNATFGRGKRPVNSMILQSIRCWSFKSWKHLRSYQDRHRLVTVPICLYLHYKVTDGDFIVQPHWEIRVPAPWADKSLSTMLICHWFVSTRIWTPDTPSHNILTLS